MRRQCTITDEYGVDHFTRRATDDKLSNMKELSLQTIVAWLKSNDARHALDEKNGVLFVLRDDAEEPHLRILDRSERGMLTWAIVLPFEIPSERQMHVCVALNLINSASFMGAWILNTQKREVYFRVTVPIVGTAWDGEALAYMVQLMLSTTGQLREPIRKVALEGADPRAVLQLKGTGPAA